MLLVSTEYIEDNHVYDFNLSLKNVSWVLIRNFWIDHKLSSSAVGNRLIFNIFLHQLKIQ